MVVEVNAADISLTYSWMTPIAHYLQLGELPQDELEANKIRKRTKKYILMSGKPYKMGITTYICRCLGEYEITLVLVEVYQGACDNHIGG